MRKNRSLGSITRLFLMMAIMAILLSGCGDNEDDKDLATAEQTEQEEQSYDENEEYEEDDTEEVRERAELNLSEETIDSAINGEGAVSSFIGEPFYNGTIEDENDALDAIYAAMEYIGGDGSTELAMPRIMTISEGLTYYTFQQVVGNISVYGGSAKLIVNKNKEAIGLVSSIIPNLEAPSSDTWAIDDIEAEEIVKKEFESDGLKIIPNASEKILLPVGGGSDSFYYSWVVYTDNVYDDVDTAYLAHYVSVDGQYLYSQPVMEPGDVDSLSGSTATFAFSGWKSDTWSGTVKTKSGREMEIEVPVMVDQESGEQVLGDTERMVLCADYSAFDNDQTLTPCKIGEDGTGDEEIITYYNFLRVYDLYATTGWTGPDGDGTPTLLLMHAVDSGGDPMKNAVYAGKTEGFQTFAFDTTDSYGECVDIVGHEFTHCFTRTAMTENLYKNDYGAINEAMSDIIGNLVAIMVDPEDEPYVIADHMISGPIRDMRNPNRFEQPAFVWDKYYVPPVSAPTEGNDNGGVHTNSSLLNYISYKLHEAGMEPEDEMYYWMGVSFIMTPRTDYEQLSYLLPWVMKIYGFDNYVKAIEDAIKEVRIASNEIPKEPENGFASATVTFPNFDATGVTIVAGFINIDTEEQFTTWPESGTNRIYATLTPGKYLFMIQITDDDTDDTTFVLSYDGGWKLLNQEEFDSALENATPEMFTSIEAGDMVTYDSDALYELIKNNIGGDEDESGNDGTGADGDIQVL